MRRATPGRACRDAGRLKSTGLYSKTPLKSLEDLREEVAALELDLNDTDSEMLNPKSIVWHLLTMAGRMTTKSDMLEAAEARQVATHLAQGYKLLSPISSWTTHLLDANLKTISATKTRAEIRAKGAEQEAVQNFTELAKRITGIVWTTAPDDGWLDAYKGRLRRELFGPLNLELPEPASD